MTTYEELATRTYARRDLSKLSATQRFTLIELAAGEPHNMPTAENTRRGKTIAGLVRAGWITLDIDNWLMTMNRQ